MLVFLLLRKRGKDDQTRRWNIEMNEARQLYLQTYGKIDQANRRMSDFSVGIKTMKYWHSAMDYAFQLALIQSYDFYVEAARGGIMSEWKIDDGKIWDLRQFLYKMSRQMLKYDPSDCAYPGDEFMRSNTQKIQINAKEFENVDSTIKASLEWNFQGLLLTSSSRKRHQSLMEDSAWTWALFWST